MNLTVIARKEDELAAMKAQVEPLGVRFLGIQASNTDFDAIAAAFKTSWQTYGRLDLLVNAAGTGVMTPFEELTKSDVDTTIDVNLKGTIYAVKLSVPYFEKTGGGNILNISSMSAIRGIPDPVNNNGIYTATKFAINGFTECMQKYLLKYGHPRHGALPRPLRQQAGGRGGHIRSALTQCSRSRHWRTLPS